MTHRLDSAFSVNQDQGVSHRAQHGGRERPFGSHVHCGPPVGRADPNSDVSTTTSMLIPGVFQPAILLTDEMNDNCLGSGLQLIKI